jgi:fructose-1,6-bisphosphatase/inositol monophosphatase family enzyme
MMADLPQSKLPTGSEGSLANAAPGIAGRGLDLSSSAQVARTRCITAALAGGMAISDLNIPQRIVAVKPDEFVGSKAIVTQSDYISQGEILKSILAVDSRSRFITEEHISDEAFRERVITLRDIEKLRSGGVYIIDELDGTPSRKFGHPEWSVSVGYLEDFRHMAGAIYAPKVENGLLFSAALGHGAALGADLGAAQKIQVNLNPDPANALVLFGIDCVIKDTYPIHFQMLGDSSRHIRSTNLCGSCALGLALVAAGRASALIQPRQSPWDWAAGKLLVEEAGGKVIFYELEGRKVTPLTALEPRHYDPERRGVGFIAANPELADWLMDFLLGLA